MVSTNSIGDIGSPWRKPARMADPPTRLSVEQYFGAPLTCLPAPSGRLQSRQIDAQAKLLLEESASVLGFPVCPARFAQI